MARAARPVESGEVAFKLSQRDLVPEALTYDEAGARPIRLGDGPKH